MKPTQIIEKKYRQIWDRIYDEAFCQALDDGQEMYQAVEAGEKAVQQTILNIQK